MLKTHYRSPIDWTLKGLEESAKTLDDWYGIAADDTKGERPSDAVIEALSDDLNTPQMDRRICTACGIARLPETNEIAASLQASLRLLGFLSESAAEWNEPKTAGQRHRREADRRFDFGSHRRPRAKGLQGIRSHPR